MPSKRWRTWLLWGLGCALLIGVGFALDATLPPQPRFVLPGSHVLRSLSPDGKILTTGTLERGEDDENPWVSLKVWDTFTGQERGEFFRGLIGSREVSITGGIPGRRPGDGFEFGAVPPGFFTDALVYSPDGRYCALMHQDGLALADLHSGQEWPAVVKARIVENVGPETAAVYRLLRRPIPTKALQEKVRLKAALEYFSDQFGGKLPIVVDKEAFAEELGADAAHLYEEEVGLPPIDNIVASTALGLILSQIAQGNAAFLIRRNVIEITTKKRALQECIWPPVFSPGGSFFAFMEAGPKVNTLHVVACTSGQLLASLSVHADASYLDFGFSADEDQLYFYANKNGAKLLSAWSSKAKQITRTFPDIAIYQFMPDGKTAFANVGVGGVDLVDLQTGQTRQFAGKMLGSGCFLMSPDKRSVVRHTEGQIEIWDVPTAKKRCTIALAEREGPFPKLFISADSRVLCAVTDRPKLFTAWDLTNGARLWPPDVPARPAADVPPAFGPMEVAEEINGGGLMMADEPYPRFTPDHRFLIERKEDRIDMLDPATGDAHASLRLAGGAAARLIVLTPDGRSMLTSWSQKDDRQPWLVEQWLDKWWPVPKTSYCFVVADVATARAQLRVNVREDAWTTTPLLSDDGRTLLTTFSSGDPEGTVITCWDVPGRPSLALVLGIPLALGCVALLTRLWFARKSKPVRPDGLL